MALPIIAGLAAQGAGNLMNMYSGIKANQRNRSEMRRNRVQARENQRRAQRVTEDENYNMSGGLLGERISDATLPAREDERALSKGLSENKKANRFSIFSQLLNMAGAAASGAQALQGGATMKPNVMGFQKGMAMGSPMGPLGSLYFGRRLGTRGGAGMVDGR